MASYLKKYVTAIASAKDYVTKWSSEQIYADEALIVPFPTLAIYDPNKQVWSINIKAWLYLPLEGKKLKNYLPSILTRKTEEKTVKWSNEDNEKIDTAAAIANEETDDDDADDDLYEDALSE
jgi:hypothetical protein